MILYILAYLLLSTFGIVFVKLGSANNAFSITKNVLNFHIDIYTIVGLVFYITSFFLWIVILQKYSLSYISPLLTGIVYVFIIIASITILHESINIYQGIGIFVILIGVVLMNIKK